MLQSEEANNPYDQPLFSHSVLSKTSLKSYMSLQTSRYRMESRVRQAILSPGKQGLLRSLNAVIIAYLVITIIIFAYFSRFAKDHMQDMLVSSTLLQNGGYKQYETTEISRRASCTYLVEKDLIPRGKYSQFSIPDYSKFCLNELE